MVDGTDRIGRRLTDEERQRRSEAMAAANRERARLRREGLLPPKPPKEEPPIDVEAELRRGLERATPGSPTHLKLLERLEQLHAQRQAEQLAAERATSADSDAFADAATRVLVFWHNRDRESVRPFFAKLRECGLRIVPLEPDVKREPENYMEAPPSQRVGDLPEPEPAVEPERSPQGMVPPTRKVLALPDESVGATPDEVIEHQRRAELPVPPALGTGVGADGTRFQTPDPADWK